MESIWTCCEVLDLESPRAVSWPLVRADQAVGCLRNQERSNSRAAWRGMLESVVVMCFTISSSASLLRNVSLAASSHPWRP